jgi:hypothetical protein
MKSVDTIIEADLRGYVEAYLEWDRDLPARTRDVNSRHIRHLGYLLCELAFGCKPSDMQLAE